MIKIAIISPDAVPLKLKESVSSNKILNTIKDKCTRATSLGIRAWKISEQLSKYFSVTLFIPDINFPSIDLIEINKDFTFESFSYENTLSTYDIDLNDKLLNFDVVIIQSNSGNCFINCSRLPKRIIVIVDGWTIPYIELPLSLLRHEENFKKVFWNRFNKMYINLLKRSNCILYNADRHYYYYESLLLTIGENQWNKVNKSNLVKLRFGIDDNKKVEKKLSSKLKLLWYGPIYPWYSPQKIIDVVSLYPDKLELHLKAIRHPRFSNFYDKMFKTVLDPLKFSNIFIDEEYNDSHYLLYNDYDAGILLAQDLLEERFALRARVFDMLSYGFPVLTNENNAIFDEIRLIDSLYPINEQNLKKKLLFYYENKNSLTVSDKSFKQIKDNFLWENNVLDLINYIQLL